MIDTIRLCGPSDYYRRRPDLKKYQVYVKRDGTETVIPEVEFEKLETHRSWYHDGFGRLTVELNPHKLLFQHNVYNYEKNPAYLHQIVRHFATHFFGRNDCYVMRCDLGGVVPFSNRLAAKQHIESLRGARPDRIRVKKTAHYNYPDSVFCPTQNWSIKAYIKGSEMGEESKFFSHFDCHSVVRYEETFRFNEMKRLGMPVKPYWGVHVRDLDTETLYNSFVERVTTWETIATPFVTDKKGLMGLLAVIDQQGQFSQVERLGVVSRSSTSRFRQLKKNQIGKTELNFVYNLPPELQSRYAYFQAAGANFLFN